MINKKLTKKEKIILSNKDKVIEKDKENDYLKNGGIVGGFGFLLGIIILTLQVIFLDKTNSVYFKAQGGLFIISCVAIIYNLFISIFSVNLFQEYFVIIKSMFTGTLNYKSNYNQLFLANMMNLIISILILIFIVDWSLWGGYNVKIGTTLIIFFTFTIIEIIKSV